MYCIYGTAKHYSQKRDSANASMKKYIVIFYKTCYFIYLTT